MPSGHDDEIAPVGVPPWRTDPHIAREIAALRRRFRAPGLDVAHELCDTHPPEAVAFTVVDGDCAAVPLTYGELADRSKRLAAALREEGVGRGTRVAVLMGKHAQLPVILLAIWRLGAVHVPLFTAFAPPAIELRVSSAGAPLVIADPDQVPKLSGLGVRTIASGDEVEALIAAHEPLAERTAVGPDGLFIQIYTSGTTGAPKGVGVPAFALAAFWSYMTYGLDVRDDDVFWNVADPGWAYGLYYGIVGPLVIGRPNILVTVRFSVPMAVRVIGTFSVTNLGGAPTVYRAIMQDAPDLRASLRAASSAGEPLTPDVTAWAPTALGADVRDHWGQTEHGMAVVNAWREPLRTPLRDGSMGLPLPGFSAAIRDGELVLSVPESPLMWFAGYVDAPEQSARRYTPDGVWYRSGDLARVDEDGFFHFAARDDDVILASGYRISPFELERILVQDPLVAEAAVVGRPDPLSGERIEAFVVLAGEVDRDTLTARLQLAVRQGYGAHGYPRRVHVVGSLPKTPSGKMQRFVLRNLTDDEVAALTEA
ncbi:AMP-binding protein [Microbacterium sp. GXF7504]